MAKDPTDTQEIWTNKHCHLQLACLCNKIWGKKIVLPCSGIQGTELVEFGYFLMGKDLQDTRVWQLVLQPLHITFCFSYMCFFCSHFSFFWSRRRFPDYRHQKCIQNHNPVNALIWKNRVTLPGNKRSQNASLSFRLYLHSTYKEKWQIVSVCTCMCTPTCPHIPTRAQTHSCAQTLMFWVHSHKTVTWFTAEEEGYCLCFGFKDMNTFFSLLLWGTKRLNDTRNLSDDSNSVPVEVSDRTILIIQITWRPWPQSRWLSKKVNNMLSNWEKGDNDFQEMDRWTENRIMKHNAVSTEVNFMVPCCLVDSKQG